MSVSGRLGTDSYGPAKRTRRGVAFSCLSATPARFGPKKGRILMAAKKKLPPRLKLPCTPEDIVVYLQECFYDMWLRWRDGAAREDSESVFAIFTSYPAMLSALIKNGGGDENRNVTNAIATLNDVHRRASDILSKWACRLDLNGGLIEVSGEHCRKLSMDDRNAWQDNR